MKKNEEESLKTGAELLKEIREVRREKREKSIVIIIWVVGWLTLMGIPMYVLFGKIHWPNNTLGILLPWAIYLFIILPVFGYFLLLAIKHHD